MRIRLRRLIPAAMIAAAAVSLTTACGSGHNTNHPLTLTDYRGVDWLTDGTVKPPKSTARKDVIHWPHTMDGAVMAAHNAQTMLDLAADGDFGAISRDYFGPGPGLQDYLNARAQITTTGTVDKSKVARIKGFRFTGYDDQDAKVELFYEQVDRSITGLTRHLIWATDTWLIQLPDIKAGDKPVKAYDTLPDDLNPLPQT